jgi:hypothetical protein
MIVSSVLGVAEHNLVFGLCFKAGTEDEDWRAETDMQQA